MRKKRLENIMGDTSEAQGKRITPEVRQRAKSNTDNKTRGN
jgi:hypothetical protein